jgi:hypothetical protein
MGIQQTFDKLRKEHLYQRVNSPKPPKNWKAGDEIWIRPTEEGQFQFFVESVQGDGSLLVVGSVPALLYLTLRVDRDGKVLDGGDFHSLQKPSIDDIQPYWHPDDPFNYNRPLE